MNLHLHTQPHNHIVLGYHIDSHQSAKMRRGDPYKRQGHLWVDRGDEEPTRLEGS